MKNDYSIHSN